MTTPKEIIDDWFQEEKYGRLECEINYGVYSTQIAKDASDHLINYLKEKGFIIIPSPNVHPESEVSNEQ